MRYPFFLSDGISFNDISSHSFSVEEFIPLLSERMKVVNHFVQQFLIGWINALNNAPDIDMMAFLPDILDGEGLPAMGCALLLP